MEATDLQSKASMQGGIIPIILQGKKRQLTNMHEMVSHCIVFIRRCYRVGKSIHKHSEAV